jgi:uncharacterized repeat protein (TIGR03803 family)
MAHLLQRGAVIYILVATSGGAHAAPVETVLATFNGSRGGYPLGGVIQDKAGNLYGTTVREGKANAGAVYELVAPSQGKTHWTAVTLYQFSGPDGQYPRGNLTFDAAGNLYGTTAIGGTNDAGTVYELSPPTNGGTKWHETLLASFSANGPAYPYAGVVFDRTGNLYGTLLGTITNDGNWKQSGVFELSPPAKGKTNWTETIIEPLRGNKGQAPTGALIIDNAGNLYGTTSLPGNVFELSPPGNGQTEWTETVLTDFKGVDAESPECTLVADQAGNLYGTTYFGGVGGSGGAVFELSPPKSGHTRWTTHVIWGFDGSDGLEPTEGNLVITKAGRLIGTTPYGGTSNAGVVFELTPPKHKNGSWTEAVLHSFNGGLDGVIPIGDLIIDKTGAVYGTAYEGGKGGEGIVYKLKP